MLETYVKKFLGSCLPEDAVQILKYCRENKLYGIGEYIGKNLVNFFPHHAIVLNETGICAMKNESHEMAFDIFLSLLNFTNLNQSELQGVKQNIQLCYPKVENRYNYYNPDIVKKLVNRTSNKFKFVTFTMTTCKRFDLFQQTMNSFLNCCTDLDKIDHWLCVDDNSSEEDREKMRKLYPFMEFYFKEPYEKGHPQSMNIIKNKVKTPYLFHLEDDWKFVIKRNYISDCFDVLHSDDRLGQCLINKNYGETSKDFGILGGFNKTTPKGTRYYVHEYCPDDQSKMAFEKKYGIGPQCAYWPHFSLRPSLMRRNILHELGEFNEKVSHFEMHYSQRYISKGYISGFLDLIHCIHIGRLTSERNDKTKLNAYDLNNEAQFSGKEQKVQEKTHVNNQEEKQEENQTGKSFRIKVVNLDRRPDRWEQFQKNNIGIPYDRFSAVDGSQLKPNRQLSRIFDGNDYNMRRGMVGCAMSHFKLYMELINSSHDFYVILEDDIEVLPNFKSKLEHILKNTPKDWDMIYLGHHYKPEYRNDEFYKDTTPTIEKWSRRKSLTESMGGTGGYVITKEGAKKLLDFIEEHTMINCIDTMQQKSADTLHVYYCIPHLFKSECWIGQAKSDLDTDIQFDYDSLTVDMNERLAQELSVYKNREVMGMVDYNEMVQLTTVETLCNPNQVYFYLDENTTNISSLKKNCVHPCYTLNNNVFFMVPHSEKEPVYFHRFKKDGKYNIEDALQF